LSLSLALMDTAQHGSVEILREVRADNQEVRLQFTRARTPQPPGYARDDQVGALHLRASIRSLRSHVGRQWPAQRTGAVVDRRRHGNGSISGNGFQSSGGRLD
jgi:hypothetical protein